MKRGALPFVVIISAALAVGLLSTFAPSPLGLHPLAAPVSAAPATVMISEPNGSGLPSGAPGYSPDSVKVVIGVNNTVEWVNNDQGASHTVNSSSVPTGAVAFGSGNMIKAPSATTAGGTYSYTFTVPGTYQYYCTYHSWMKGTVVVLAATTSGATTTATTPEFPAGAVAAVLLVAIIGMVLALRVFPIRSRGSQPA